MEQTNYIGVYLAAEGLFAAALSDRGNPADARYMFIPLTAADSGQPVLTAAVRQLVQQSGPHEESAVAIRGSLISQYELHSEFTDPRQIENTIRFDAEEAAAADVSSMAVAFEITGSDSTGSQVSVYTAARQVLTDTLLDLQAGSLDPTVMEPDAVCLARMIQKAGIPDMAGRMFLLIFVRTCYLLTWQDANFAPKMRIFLLPDDTDKTSALCRQIVLTVAGLPAGSVKTLVLAGSTEQVDLARMTSSTGLSVESMDLLRQLNIQIPPDTPAHQAEGFLFACGSALALAGRGRRADFRKDFMPYQGRRRILQKSLRLVAISVTILCVMFGLYFQSRAARMKNYSRQIQDKLLTDYKAAMYGQKPPAGISFGTKLRSELNRVRQLQQGGLVEGSVTARLTYVLEAINNSPPSVDVVIKSITITERSISIIGDTNSRKSTRDLFDAIKKHSKLMVSEERFNYGTRDEFVLSLKTKEEK